MRPAAFARIDSGQSKPASAARLNALFTFRSAEPNRIFIALGAMNSVLVCFLAGADDAHVAVHDASAPLCWARVHRVLRRALRGREGTHDARSPGRARTEPADRAGKAGRALDSCPSFMSRPRAARLLRRSAARLVWRSFAWHQRMRPLGQGSLHPPLWRRCRSRVPRRRILQGRAAAVRQRRAPPPGTAGNKTVGRPRAGRPSTWRP